MKYLIAFSGGMDSTVLLYALRHAPEVRAVHVHHGLSLHADHWAEHCKKICAHLNIPLEIISLKLQKKPQISLEALAREARYEAFKKMMMPGEVLVTAHHQNDQAETFLFQAFRGAGPKGLSAMPRLKRFAQAWHWRPFLSLTRDALTRYAKKNRLAWIHDESNENISFDRNFIRHTLIPKVEKRWPSVIQNLSRAAELQAELAQFLDEQLKTVWQKMAAEIEKLQLHPAIVSEYNIFPLALLEALAPSLQQWALREWLRQHAQVTVSKKTLARILQEVVRAKKDKQPELKVGDYWLRRYARALWLVPITASALLAPQLPLTQAKELHIRTRQGGERFRPLGRKHSQPLKKFFNERKIPPWLRDKLPLFFHGKKIIFIAGIQEKGY